MSLTWTTIKRCSRSRIRPAKFNFGTGTGMFEKMDPWLQPLSIRSTNLPGVNDSPNGLLSTYSVLLLVIFFLQLRGSLHLSTTGISERERGELTKPTAWNGEVTDEELGRNFLEFFAFVGSFRCLGEDGKKLAVWWSAGCQEW